MPNSNDKTTVGMHVDVELRDRIKEQAEREHRTISSLLRSIVLPEIQRREEEQPTRQAA